MSALSLPPTISDSVYCVSSEMGGLMPESSHRTSIWPAVRLAPAEGSVNLTSAWLTDAQQHKRTSTAVVHPGTAPKGECIIAQ
jgi:hypothetical protein